MPDRHGWTALIGAVVSVVLGRLFGLIELYVLGASLAIAVVVAWISVRRRPPQFEIRRRPRPATITAGHAARVELHVRNQGPRPSPHVQLWEPVGGRGGAPMQLGRLAAGERASAAYRIPTARRGVVTLGPMWVERRDPFGLAARSITVGSAAEVLVLPQVLPLPAPTAGGAGHLGTHLRMKAFGQTGGEFHSMRLYQPGDDLRRINWKATARSTDLIVTETEPDGLRRCTVVLDTDGHDEDSFERAVVVAASVVVAACGARLHTRFRAPSIVIDGADVEGATLRYLARVEPMPAPSLSAASGASHDHLGLVVIVAATSDGHIERLARGDTTPADTVIVVATRTNAVGGRFDLDGTSLDTFRSSWSELVAGRRSAT